VTPCTDASSRLPILGVAVKQIVVLMIAGDQRQTALIHPTRQTAAMMTDRPAAAGADVG